MGENGTAVVVLVAGMTFVTFLGLLGVAFAEHGRFVYSEKLTAEQIAAHTQERLSVEVIRGTDNADIRVINRGSYPSVVLAILCSDDGSLSTLPLDPPVGIGPLENHAISVGVGIDNRTKVGLLTTCGNAFWED